MPNPLALHEVDLGPDGPLWLGQCTGDGRAGVILLNSNPDAGTPAQRHALRTFAHQYVELIAGGAPLHAHAS